MRFRLAVLLIAIGALSFAGTWALHGAVWAQDDDDKATEENRAELGVIIADLSEKTAEMLDIDTAEGAYVRYVYGGSAAHDAGLRSGDVIVAVDNTPINNREDLIEAVKSRKPGDRIEVSFIRKGERQTLTVTLGERERRRDAWSMVYAAPHITRLEGPTMRAYMKAPKLAVMLGGNRYIGINYDELNAQLGEYFGVADGRGILVTEVTEDSPAEKAGLKAGDVIVSAGGKDIEDGRDLRRAINEHEGEEPLELVVLRRGERMTIQVTPEEREGYFYKYGEAMAGLEKLKDMDIYIGEMEHHLEDIEIHAPDIDIHVPDFDIYIPEIIDEPFLFNFDDFGEHGFRFRLRIDKDGHVDFNDKSFDSIEEFKDYLDSEEFEQYKDEIGEKIRTRIKKNLDRIKARTTSKVVV